MSLWAWFAISLLGFIVFAALALLGIGAGNDGGPEPSTKGHPDERPRSRPLFD